MATTRNPFMSAIEELCEEKGLDKDVILETVEAALAAAYRKDYGKPKQTLKAKLHPETGEADMFRSYVVVESEEEVKESEQELTLDQASKFDKKAKVGDEILIPLEKHSDFGRIAAQTAKQVIIQRIREAEREMLYKEFKDKEEHVVNATVQQLEGRNVVVALGKANGIMYPADQIREERYYIGQRLKVYVKEVAETVRGPQILVSRSDKELIRGLFELEVPEIQTGSVEIKSITREAGSRTKIAVIATEDNIDPVGSCVGQRGTRVQAVLGEIGDEKIDIVLWDEDVEQFIMNALSPAKTRKIVINSKENKAIVYVAEDSLSLAIGKGGQNVRLASKLTGWGIDVMLDEDNAKDDEDEAEEGEEKPKTKKKASKKSK
jgi:transcription termination/antitermination protein NusA